MEGILQRILAYIAVTGIIEISRKIAVTLITLRVA
jgi:hypothetical protein